MNFPVNFPLFSSYVTVIISQSAAPRQRPSNYGERKNVHVQKKESCATAH